VSAPARPSSSAGASSAGVPGVLPGVLRLGLARTRLELLTYFRERDAMVFIFAYPLIMLAIFATVFGQNGATVGPEPGIPFAQYFLPGMLATGIMLSSFQNLAITIAVERDDGGLKRLHGTPLPPAAYFLGKTGEVLVTSLVQTALLLAAAALLFDVPLPTTAAAWTTFAWVFLLNGVCYVLYSVVTRHLARDLWPTRTDVRGIGALGLHLDDELLEWLDRHRVAFAVRHDHGSIELRLLLGRGLHQFHAHDLRARLRRLHHLEEFDRVAVRTVRRGVERAGDLESGRRYPGRCQHREILQVVRADIRILIIVRCDPVVRSVRWRIQINSEPGV